MNPTPAEITTHYLQEHQLTLEAFANALGIGAVKEQVHQWKTGKHKPSLDTLFKVTDSEKAEAWAKEWAGECICAIRGVPTSVNLQKLEPC